MPQNRPPAFEICVDHVAGLAACMQVADRIELCCGLDIGGLTPSAGLMQAAKASGVETHVLIRPRTGGFEFSDADMQAAINDIKRAKTIGLHGVVIGAVADGALDDAILAKMIDAAQGMTVTLHRAFDVVNDPIYALEQAIQLGFERILTSGGAPSATDGSALLAELVRRSAGRIDIMAGSGVTSANVADLVRMTGVRSVHASCSTTSPTQGKVRDLGFGPQERSVDPVEAKRLKAAFLDAVL